MASARFIVGKTESSLKLIRGTSTGSTSGLSAGSQMCVVVNVGWSMISVVDFERTDLQLGWLVRRGAKGCRY